MSCTRIVTVLLTVFLSCLLFCTRVYADAPDDIGGGWDPAQGAGAGQSADVDEEEVDDYAPPPTPAKKSAHRAPADYSARLPQHLRPIGEKFILIDPKRHVWGAYDVNGDLVRSGLATSGSSWCRDLRRPCKTTSGVYRIQSLGGPGCVSGKFPLPDGGAPMPYCMFFNQGQAIHGSHNVVESNVSHGCVRVHVQDAEWLRYNFVTVGTRIIIQPY